ncbi:hypothetical protein GCM10028803_19310 [Larkinella knui]|uniref:Alpha glucuronidase N-terminal domain-containing protein n=1 Tax=Larkinella knui TaxID=2025310 RepID=A0A3P1CV61_9BACT|nr:hypothetical protein [Larkinella knui]RRB17026.1 hypothetical protein EHT87_01720 [Larkinella knui]
MTPRITLLFILLAFQLAAQPVSLKNAVILVSPSIPSPMRTTAPQMLVEEIAKRTNSSLKLAQAWPTGSSATIALALSSDKAVAGKPVPSRTGTDLAEQKPEGFRIVTEGATLWIIGADARGILFGSGWLLRNLKMDGKRLELAGPVDVATSPAYPIRGHQLGYRTTANSYDAWTVAQFEQYYRDLAVFGTNAIEGIPFHEEEKASPHFKIPAAQMQVRLSELCQKYDLDYWVWTPAEFELTDEAKRKAEIEKHEAFYQSCPRLDHIFFPGGDPGDNHPREVMAFLKDLQGRLVKYHPKAKVWISLQGFSTEQIDYFYKYLEQNKPTWLQGVVSGPSSPPMAETRFRLPKNYQHREYPDLTHNVRCEFPVERWDQAYTLTLGREAINPRPFFFAGIHGKYAPFTDGFVSYSDGCHDDINKITWSQRAWDPARSVNEILADYGRFFFGWPLATEVADGIAALENNWQGPLAQNGGVEATFSFWKTLETAHPELKNNWRWQMLVLRAYYDTYTRRRLIYEQGLEKTANALLAQATETGIENTLNLALATEEKADKERISVDLRKRIETLCADLYASIGLQTSVPKYKAKNYERGCLLDFVDYPLNNRWWLADEFKKIRAMKTPKEQVERMHVIGNWETPGVGSFYDDVSSGGNSPRVKTISEDATDIAWWDNGSSRARLSTQTFQNDPALDYDNLDPGARYIIRVAGSGDALLRVDGYRLKPLIYNKAPETFKEWIVPLSLTQDGRISVTFDEPEESHLNWRQHSKISDVWLLKQ